VTGTEGAFTPGIFFGVLGSHLSFPCRGFRWPRRRLPSVAKRHPLLFRKNLPAGGPRAPPKNTILLPLVSHSPFLITTTPPAVSLPIGSNSVYTAPSGIAPSTEEEYFFPVRRTFLNFPFRVLRVKSSWVNDLLPVRQSGRSSFALRHYGYLAPLFPLYLTEPIF